MNTQQELLRILNATNKYYKSPTANGWEPATATDAVFATHKTTGRIFVFSLDPDTKVIKTESYSFKKPGSITIYTGTAEAGNILIAPDMILVLHTLFNFDFASDAIFVIDKNRISKHKMKTQKSPASTASDATATGPTKYNGSHKQFLNRRRSGLLSVSSSRKLSKFLRFLIYFESPFRR